MGRAWEYWTTRLTKAGELPPRGGKRKGAKTRRRQRRAKKSSAASAGASDKLA